MPLEKQVVSLELAKGLKELGYPQDSLFYWYGNEIVSRQYLEDRAENYLGVYEKAISAPTAGELGEILPASEVVTWKINDIWICGYSETGIDEFYIDTYPITEEADTEADARASLLQYLLENNIIKHNEIN